MPTDVFIAFKNLDANGAPTRDSEIARDIYEFLTTKGLEVFFSVVTLEDLGTSAYKKAIDKALDSAAVLVAIGTSADHLNSTWVSYEWDSFYNDILSRIKPNGRVFTYIEGMTTVALPRALRQTQTFLHSPESLQRLFNFIIRALPDLEGSLKRTLPAPNKGRPEQVNRLAHRSPGCIFVSYASPDLTIAEYIVKQLQDKGLLVWFDKQQIEPGVDWKETLREAVEERCGLFLSLISATTSQRLEGFNIFERNLAARRRDTFVDNAVFYIPVRIDDQQPLFPANEPRGIKKIQAERKPGGHLDGDFIEYLRQLQLEYIKRCGLTFTPPPPAP